MQIEEQIKALQRIKCKMDLFREVKESAQAALFTDIAPARASDGYKELEAEHPGLLEEFRDELVAFCASRIEALGNPKAAKVPEKARAAEPPSPPPTPTATIPQIEEEPADPLKFLLKYRHLDGKRVVFETKDGKVEGEVRGLLAPYVVVESDSGYNINISPKELKVIQ